MNKLIFNIITICEKQIEEILKKIKEIADTTENDDLYDYLSYSHNGYYLLNIHDPDLLTHLEMSEEDKETLEEVYDYISSNEMVIIKDLFDEMYDYFNERNDDEDIVTTISNIQVDLEDNLLSSLSSIENLKELLIGGY